MTWVQTAIAAIATVLGLIVFVLGMWIALTQEDDLRPDGVERFY